MTHTGYTTGTIEDCAVWRRHHMRKLVPPDAEQVTRIHLAIKQSRNLSAITADNGVATVEIEGHLAIIHCPHRCEDGRLVDGIRYHVKIADRRGLDRVLDYMAEYAPLEDWR